MDRRKIGFRTILVGAFVLLSGAGGLMFIGQDIWMRMIFYGFFAVGLAMIAIGTYLDKY